MSLKRLFVRSRTLNVPATVEDSTHEDHKVFFGNIVSLSPGGIGFISDQRFDVEDTLKISPLTQPLAAIDTVSANVLWSKNLPENRFLFGCKFLSITEKQKAFLEIQLPALYSRDKRTKGKIIPLTLGLGLGIAMPLVFWSARWYSSFHAPLWSVLLIYGIVLFRIWETFLTSKESDPMKDSDDWTISAVVFYYVLMLIGISWEISYIRPTISLPISLIGAGLYGLAAVWRFYSMRALGENWQIHVFDDMQNSGKQRRMVNNNGPYRLLRHPIYLGVILELVAIPLIFNAFMTLGFVLLVNVPLQILRMKLEEKTLLAQFGADYAEYMLNSGALLPTSRKKERNSDKRKNSFSLERVERRKR